MKKLLALAACSLPLALGPIAYGAGTAEHRPAETQGSGVGTGMPGTPGTTADGSVKPNDPRAGTPDHRDQSAHPTDRAGHPTSTMQQNGAPAKPETSDSDLKKTPGDDNAPADASGGTGGTGTGGGASGSGAGNAGGASQ